ncbi:MAG: carbohydrate ABC transporter permease, partial [Rhizobiales bacterium]|nr:carbohydrate ABC transporter permease [Hyphomicrobiales bacterium]
MQLSKNMQNTARKTMIHIVLISFTVLALFPILIVVVNSFKSRRGIFKSPLSFPTEKTFSVSGYETVLFRSDFELYFSNSMIVTVTSLCLILLFGAMASYTFAEYRFKGNTLLGLFM